MAHATNALDQVRAAVGDAVVVPDGPLFLSVIIRTQGRRPGTLRDALVCLLAQTSDDFEVLIVVHSDDPAAEGAVARVVDEEAAALGSRVRLLSCAGGTLARPLNVAVDAAQGRYVAFFDDDDLVLDDWVERFRDAAAAAPGRIVRTRVVDQNCREERFHNGENGLVADGPFTYAYPRTFSLLEHTLGGTSPFHGFALPRTAFATLGLRFTEAIAVHEDWELQTRAVQYLGVTSSPEVTAVYRRHHSGDTLATHPSAIRDVLFGELVRERLTNEVFLIDGEELLWFRDRIKQADEIWHQKNDVIAELERTQADNATLRQSLDHQHNARPLVSRAVRKVRRTGGAWLRRVGVRRN